MYKRIFLIFCSLFLIVSCDNNNPSNNPKRNSVSKEDFFDKFSKPVTSESRLKEIYGDEPQNPKKYRGSKESYCQEEHLGLDKFLQFLYKIDGNLPPINDSKVKSIRYLTKEFHNHENNEKERNRFFQELFPDPDYYQLKLQDDIKELISMLEKLEKSWPKDQLNLKTYLDKLRGKEYYDTNDQRFFLGSLDLIFKSYDKSIALFRQIDDTNEAFKRLNALSRLNKTGLPFNDSSDQYKEYYSSKLMFPQSLEYMHTCHVSYLGSF